MTDDFLAALREREEVSSLFTFFTANYPQYELIIDTDAVYQKGLTTETVLNNLNIQVGSTYEQGFILFNQFYKVYVQAWPQFRATPNDLEDMFVTNEEGEQVPYSAFMSLEKKQGLNEIDRFNLYPAAVIQGAPAAGFSTAQAIDAVEEVAARTLPRGYGIDWSGLSYDESRKGNEALYIFLVVVAFVYLLLVA